MYVAFYKNRSLSYNNAYFVDKIKYNTSQSLIMFLINFQGVFPFKKKLKQYTSTKNEFAIKRFIRVQSLQILCWFIIWPLSSEAKKYVNATARDMQFSLTHKKKKTSFFPSELYQRLGQLTNVFVVSMF